MFIRDEIWNRIRGQFNEPEKEKLRAAITGQTICPPGCTVDESRIDDELRVKLKMAMRRVHAHGSQ